MRTPRPVPRAACARSVARLSLHCKESKMAQDTRTSTTTGASTTAGGLTGSSTEGAAITGRSHLDDHSGPGPEVMAASDFEGEDVVNREGETLGDIEEIMLDVRSGRIAYAVLGAGGFLG